MKFSRMLAVGAAAALVGVSTLAIGGTASAADFYVDDTQFPPETSPYSPGWFTGGGSLGTLTSTTSGLVMDGTTGRIQILNGTTPATGLVSLVDTAEFTLTSGQAIFNIPVFSNATGPDSGYTTLIAVNPGQLGLASTSPNAWQTTFDITDSVGTVVYAAGSTASLLEFQTALEDANAATDYEILAFGAFVPAAGAATVAKITWAGDTHWFLPTPTATVTPASLTIAAMGTTGVSGVFTGFIPGEAVTPFFASSGSGGPIPGSFTADTNGAVTVTYSQTGVTAGGYFLGVMGDVSGAESVGAFAVTANPAALAATGADFTPAIVAGGVLMMLGAGFVLAGRRRAAAHRK